MASKGDGEAGGDPARRQEMAFLLLDGEVPMIQSLGRHEAGHYIVARALGFETGEVSICFFNSEHSEGSVETELVQYEGPFEAQAFLEKRIQVLFAGVMAESLVDGAVDEAAAKVKAEREGRQDRNIASEYVCMVRRYRHPGLTERNHIRKAQGAIFEELWEGARKLVERHHVAIFILGGHLAAKVEQASETYLTSNEEVEALPALQGFFPRPSHKC